MLKYCAVPVMALMMTTASAQSEQKCLMSGKLAEVTAQMRLDGASEDYAISAVKEASAEGPKRPRLRQEVIDNDKIAVIQYVYTVRQNPADARATVYAKCMLGGLGHIDWKKHPEALHAK